MRTVVGGLEDWLSASLVGSLFGWLAGSLFGWLVGWLVVSVRGSSSNARKLSTSALSRISPRGSGFNSAGYTYGGNSPGESTGVSFGINPSTVYSPSLKSIGNPPTVAIDTMTPKQYSNSIFEQIFAGMMTFFRTGC